METTTNETTYTPHTTAAPRYTRSELMEFCELPEDIQSEMRRKDMDYLELSELQSEFFVDFFGEYLPVSDFIRCNYAEGSPRFHLFDAVCGTTYFSAYFLKLSSDGSTALVAERFS